MNITTSASNLKPSSRKNTISGASGSRSPNNSRQRTTLQQQKSPGQQAIKTSMFERKKQNSLRKPSKTANVSISNKKLVSDSSPKVLTFDTNTSNSSDPDAALIVNQQNIKQDEASRKESLDLNEEVKVDPSKTMQKALSIDTNKDDGIKSVLVICTGGTLTMVNTPDGYKTSKGLKGRLQQMHTFHDQQYAEEIDLNPDFLVTPISFQSKARVKYLVLELEVLIDSSNITLQQQVDLAEVVFANYKLFDGFVVIHGTDTMAYSASLFSFLFENLNKSIVFTGSQIPLSELRNDAGNNLLVALLCAGQLEIPEVLVAFDNRIIRGNRSTKSNSMYLNAFDSPNMDPLGKVGVSFDIQWDRVLNYSQGECQLFTQISSCISFITMSPCTNLNSLKLVFKHSKAVILAGYGAGNLPTDNAILMGLIQQAIQDGVIIVIKSQCYQGSVSDLYETGRLLTRLGCILGFDMTIECLIAKLAYLIGKGYSMDKVKKLMSTSIRGELTQPKRKKNTTSMKEYLSEKVNTVISDNNVEELDNLISQGADLNAKNYIGKSPLHIACLGGNYDMIQYLIKQGIDLNSLDKQSRSASYVALENRHFDCVRLIYSHGGKVVGGQSRLSKMLCECGFSNDIETLKVLNDCGADLSVADYDHRTVGHLAAAENNIEILEYLCSETNFNMDVKDRWDNTCFDEVQDRKQIKNLKKLIREREERQTDQE